MEAIIMVFESGNLSLFVMSRCLSCLSYELCFSNGSVIIKQQDVNLTVHSVYFNFRWPLRVTRYSDYMHVTIFNGNFPLSSFNDFVAIACIQKICILVTIWQFRSRTGTSVGG